MEDQENISEAHTVRRSNDFSGVMGLLNPIDSDPTVPVIEPEIDQRPVSYLNAQGYPEESSLNHGITVSENAGVDVSGLAGTEVYEQRGAANNFGQDIAPAISIVPEEKFIDIHFLFTLGEVAENNAWEYLDLNINVTQNYQKNPLDNSPPPDNSAQTSQQLYEKAVPGGKHLKEIAVRISIKNTIENVHRRYKFQLFCTMKEKPDAVHRLHNQGTYTQWSKMEACVFVNFLETKQYLRPINRDIVRSVFIERQSTNEPDFFLGSFAFDGIGLYHVNPSETVLQERDEKYSPTSVPATILAGDENVLIVNEEDRVYEARKARAGRPYHRVTSELLMTRAQVEKIIEIRERWQGLTPRQRRNHVSEPDFYSFFTLNRDEAARILPVCTTWFKDVIRHQGVKVWPGRPLRRSGALLEELKVQLRSEEAALQYTNPNTPERDEREHKIGTLKTEIEKVLNERIAIVKKYVTPAYFAQYEMLHGKQYLDPTWEALPPPIPDQRP